MMREKMKVAAAQRTVPPFRDELRTRRAVLYACAFGVRKAGKLLGIDPAKIALWRRRLEIIDDRSYERLPPKHFQKKLSLEHAREIRQALRDGEKYEYLAALHGVHVSTIRRIKIGQLYPELKAAEDRAAWDRLGGVAA